jgi:hypothetical protein
MPDARVGSRAPALTLRLYGALGDHDWPTNASPIIPNT